MLTAAIRRAAAPWMLVALTGVVCAGAPAPEAQKTSASHGGSSLSPIPKGASYGLAAGLWIDPSFTQLGSMSGELFDAGGGLEYVLIAKTSEFIAQGEPGLRFGGIWGELYEPNGAATGIEVAGEWLIDESTGKGSFQLTCFLGGASPTAPLLALGSVDGALGKPKQLSTGCIVLAASVPVPGEVSAGGPLVPHGQAPGGSSASLVLRDFRARWTMI
jgi:hypothetical protein